MKLLFLALVAFVTGDMASETASASLTGWYGGFRGNRGKYGRRPIRRNRRNMRTRIGGGRFGKNYKGFLGGRRYDRRRNNYQRRRQNTRLTRRRKNRFLAGARGRRRHQGAAGGRRGSLHQRQVNRQGQRRVNRRVRNARAAGRRDRRDREHRRGGALAQTANRMGLSGSEGNNTYSTNNNKMKRVNYKTHHARSSDTGATSFNSTSKQTNNRRGDRKFNKFNKRRDDNRNFKKFNDYGRNKKNSGYYTNDKKINDSANQASGYLKANQAGKKHQQLFKKQGAYNDYARGKQTYDDSDYGFKNNKLAGKSFNDKKRANSYGGGQARSMYGQIHGKDVSRNMYNKH